MGTSAHYRQLSLPALADAVGEAAAGQFDLPAVILPPGLRAGPSRPGHAAARPASSASASLRDSPSRPSHASGRPSLWYALHFPQLATLEPPRRQQCLAELADLALAVTSTVRYQPLALVCEIRSSLKYFGGLDALRRHLRPLLEERLAAWALPVAFQQGACPTMTGSLWLARAGRGGPEGGVESGSEGTLEGGVIYRKEDLRRALGELPVAVMHLDETASRRLRNMGILLLRDLWRLPSSGLRRRFGAEFVGQLGRALGEAPEWGADYKPAPAFETSCELSLPVWTLARLLPVADELLAQLVAFLRERTLSVSLLAFELSHEARPPTVVTLGLGRGSCDHGQLSALLETHFSTLQLPAPVVGLRLAAKQLEAFAAESESLLGPAAAAPPSADFEQLLNQLRARLGEGGVRSLGCLAEHGPEYADAAATPASWDAASASGPVTAQQRPLWLLPEPRLLTWRRGRLCHRAPLRLLSGPERIESRWWSGKDLCRDYYVARERGGGRLWVYRERDGARRWFLHGIFS